MVLAGYRAFFSLPFSSTETRQDDVGDKDIAVIFPEAEEQRLDFPMRISQAAVPSMFTLGNLLSGFFAIIEAGQGNLTVACWLVVLAGFFDLLDGTVARATRATSAFGIQLDSLSDLVSFGVAPSLLLYQAGLSDVRFGAFVAALPVLCGAVRLAQFNLVGVVREGQKPDRDRGLPVPVAAGVIVSFLLTYESLDWFADLVGDRLNVLLPLPFLVSLLMLTRIRFPVLWFPTPKNVRRRPWQYVGFLVALVLVLVFREVGLLFSVGAYLLTGLGGALAWSIRALHAEENSQFRSSDP